MPELHRTLSIPSLSTSDPKLLSATARRTFPYQMNSRHVLNHSHLAFVELLCSDDLTKVPRLQKDSWQDQQAQVSDDFRVRPPPGTRTDLEHHCRGRARSCSLPRGQPHQGPHLSIRGGLLEMPETHDCCRPQIKTDQRGHEADGVSRSRLSQGHRSQP